MRAPSLALATLLLCAPLSASWWPAWSPSVVRMTVGETATVQVKAMWSGLVDYGNGVHWTFRSDSPNVATAHVRMDSSALQDVEIVAIGPGTASIRQEGPTGVLGGTNWVVINVVCGDEPPVRAAAPELRARLGDPVSLAIVSEIASRTTFTWYLGEIGDHSQPLYLAGPEVVYKPEHPGTTRVWVEAHTPCSTSAAQFTIEVPLPKRRAAH